MTDVKKTIILTAEEIEIAKAFGFSPQEYARMKSDLEKAKAEHEAWLQTPAGTAYMIEKEIKRERELKRKNKYMREYRAKKRAETLENMGAMK
jgi:acetyl-CoA carboxylase beta subunit